MRVIGGSARSLKLLAPEGLDVRPTIDRYKETVFNILNQHVVGAEVLDIFAGSGANGIEALSRGAHEAVFIENAPKALRSIETNLQFTKLKEKAILMKYDYASALTMCKDQGRVFDLIYMDPPFDGDFEDQTLELIFKHDLLAEDGRIVCESAVHTDILIRNDGYEIYKEKAFKTCKFTFIRRIDN